MDKLLYINTVEDIRLREMVQNLEDNTQKFNGHVYVDLGLPSGTLWAKMNVGANNETDYGLYFAWGETQGYADANSGKAFSWNDYKYGVYDRTNTNHGMTKYNNTDGKTIFELEDDAAAVNMGGQWHMPTISQMEELAYGTTNGYVASDGTFLQYTWVPEGNYAKPSETTASTGSKFGGIAGYMFFKTGVTLSDALSNGEYLFVPSAGYCDEGSIISIGEIGYVWLSSLDSDYVGGALMLNFGDEGATLDHSNRCEGKSVRGVVG